MFNLHGGDKSAAGGGGLVRKTAEWLCTDISWFSFVECQLRNFLGSAKWDRIQYGKSGATYHQPRVFEQGSFGFWLDQIYDFVWIGSLLLQG